MKVWCEKHGMGPQDERWKVHMEELEDKDAGTSFTGQVCPECHLELQSGYRKMKRNLKIQCRDVIRLRAENSQLQALVNSIAETVKQLSGQDPFELARQTYVMTKFHDTQHMREQGDLLKIMPNMIVQLARKGRKK